MSEPFLGELRLMSFDFPPKGWAECNGQVLPVRQNQDLALLLGTMYGGDGKTTFGLPDLRGRFPLGVDGSYRQGVKAGTESHTLTQNELPLHSHPIMASKSAGNQAGPKVLASVSNTYRGADNLTTLHPDTLLPAGGGKPHENRQPYASLNWCIALQGYPPER
jgi:microcystin-dependent protein